MERGNFRVHVVNDSRYEAGEVVGGWLELPADPRDVNRFLREEVGTDAVLYEDYRIIGYENPPIAGVESLIDEDVNIHGVNMACALVDGLSARDRDVVATFLGIEHDEELTPDQFASICLQPEKLPYMEYEDEDVSHSVEERYGYTIYRHDERLQTQLQGLGAEDRLDLEEYGRRMQVEHGDVLGADGFIAGGFQADLTLYEGEEIDRLMIDRIDPSLREPFMELFDEMAKLRVARGLKLDVGQYNYRDGLLVEGLFHEQDHPEHPGELRGLIVTPIPVGEAVRLAGNGLPVAAASPEAYPPTLIEDKDEVSSLLGEIAGRGDLPNTWVFDLPELVKEAVREERATFASMARPEVGRREVTTGSPAADISGQSAVPNGPAQVTERKVTQAK